MSLPAHLAQWELNYRAGKEINCYPVESLVSGFFRWRQLLPPAGGSERPRVLDLGCGCGNNAWFLAEEGFEVLGVDISPTAIDYAKALVKRRGQHAEFVCSSIQTLSNDNRRFDFVVDRACLTHNPLDFGECLEKTREALNDGGLLYSWVFDWDYGLRALGKRISSNGYGDFPAHTGWYNMHTLFLKEADLQKFYVGFELLKRVRNVHYRGGGEITADWSLLWRKTS